jgi:hypothetical protein
MLFMTMNEKREEKKKKYSDDENSQCSETARTQTGWRIEYMIHTRGRTNALLARRLIISLSSHLETNMSERGARILL